MMRKQEMQHIPLLEAVAQLVAEAGANCALDVSGWDVPKLYAAHHPSKGTGPHEIVSAAGQLDVWTSPDGRSPEVLKTNVTAAQAAEYVINDYFRWKTEYIRRHERS